MGIKHLRKFIIEKDMVNIYNTINNFTKQAKKNDMCIVAIDVWLFAYKFKYSCNDILLAFSNLIIKLLFNNILPIPVFDGNPPIEKKNVVDNRLNKKIKIKEQIYLLEKEINETNKEEIMKTINKLNKQSITITYNDIYNLKTFFTLMNIPFLSANGEADSLCAKLYKENIIDACLSDDMDILVQGCNRLIKISKNKVIEYNLENILEKLNIEYTQFIDLCILFGCDYHTYKFPLKPNECYENIKKYGNIENINNFYNLHNLNYKKIKKIFMSSADNEIIPNNFNPSIKNKINIDNVLYFLRQNSYNINNYVYYNYKKKLIYINNNIIKL